MQNVPLVALFIFGLIVTGYWSYQAFTRRQFQVEETPTLPRYMTRRPLFYYGMGAFIISSLCIYGLMFFFFKDFLPILRLFNGPAFDVAATAQEVGALKLPLIIVLAAAIFIGLLKIEHRFNPVMVFRNIVHAWAAIPRKTGELVANARGSLEVPSDERKGVANDPEKYFVALGDFKKNRGTLERRWAESSYMKRWLSQQEVTGRHASFFKAPTLLWEQVGKSYGKAAQQVGIIRNSDENTGVTAEFIEDVARDVEAVQRSLCRLSVCFLIYDNNQEKDLWDAAEAFGIPGRPVHIPNPLWRMPLFFVGVVVAVFVGCLASAIMFDFFVPGHSLFQALKENFQDETVYRWIGFALFVWCIPILVTLSFRYFDHRINPRAPGIYPANYAFNSILGAVIAAVSLTSAIYILSPSDPSLAEKGFGELLFRNFRWSAGPGILCAFIAFRLDTFRLREEPVWLLRRLGWIAVCVLVIGLAILPPTFAIEQKVGLWSLDKTYTVVIGTILTIALTLASIAEYSRIRSPQRPQAQVDAHA